RAAGGSAIEPLGIHLFSFGGLARTGAWLRAVADGAFTLDEAAAVRGAPSDARRRVLSIRRNRTGAASLPSGTSPRTSVLASWPETPGRRAHRPSRGRGGSHVPPFSSAQQQQLPQELPAGPLSVSAPPAPELAPGAVPWPGQTRRVVLQGVRTERLRARSF